jgi:hypothetical protein
MEWKIILLCMSVGMMLKHIASGLAGDYQPRQNGKRQLVEPMAGSTHLADQLIATWHSIMNVD